LNVFVDGQSCVSIRPFRRRRRDGESLPVQLSVLARIAGLVVQTEKFKQVVLRIGGDRRVTDRVSREPRL
jgi:hypothetical protein